MQKNAKKSKKNAFSLFFTFEVLLNFERKKRRLSHDNQTFSFNLKSNTMKNTVQKYCFLTI